MRASDCVPVNEVSMVQDVAVRDLQTETQYGVVGYLTWWREEFVLVDSFLFRLFPLSLLLLVFILLLLFLQLPPFLLLRVVLEHTACVEAGTPVFNRITFVWRHLWFVADGLAPRVVPTAWQRPHALRHKIALSGKAVANAITKVDIP